jgi:hypothetical protein
MKTKVKIKTENFLFWMLFYHKTERNIEFSYYRWSDVQQCSPFCQIITWNCKQNEHTILVNRQLREKNNDSCPHHNSEVKS